MEDLTSESKLIMMKKKSGDTGSGNQKYEKHGKYGKREDG